MDIQGLQFIDTATADAFALANQGQLLVSARDGEVFVLANGASDAAPGIYIYTSSTNSEFAALGNPAMYKGAWSAGAYIVNDIVTHSGITYICKAPVVLADANPATATTKWSVLVGMPVSAFSSLTGKPTTLTGYGITDAYTSAQVDSAISAATPSFSTLAGLPTTLSGYGITDAVSTAALALKAPLSNPTFSTNLTLSATSNPYIRARATDGSSVGFAAYGGSVHAPSFAGDDNAANLQMYIDTANSQAIIGVQTDGWGYTPCTLKFYNANHLAQTIDASGNVVFPIKVTVPTPTSATDAATKAYVDSAAATPAFSAITGKPTTLSGYGITDGIPAFSAITGKPTTLSGYGITDAYSKTVIDSALNLKANLSSPTFSGTTTVAGITNTGTVVGFPYDIALSLIGKPTDAAVLGRFAASRAFTITSTSFNASIAKAAVAATASTVITVKKNGSAVGTITFAASGTTGTWSYSANGTFAIGDVLTIENQAIADATFADAELTILAVTA